MVSISLEIYYECVISMQLVTRGMCMTRPLSYPVNGVTRGSSMSFNMAVFDSIVLGKERAGYSVASANFS